jgi:hypothetical protein
VHRSTPSIASLAAALAKAQAELVNPEKSLVAIISSGHRGGRDQSFRYAPLSSGLDIVRKVLGQHEMRRKRVHQAQFMRSIEWMGIIYHTEEIRSRTMPQSGTPS